MTFLRELDALDRRHANGTLKTATYHRLVDEQHRVASIEIWMAAAQLTGLACRLVDYRLRLTGTEKRR